MTEPPIKMIYEGLFHAGAEANLIGEPNRRTYQRTAERIAFRAVTSGQIAARLVRAAHTTPAGEHQITGSWFIADPFGAVSAHRGQFVGRGGPWDLADAIILGSCHAVEKPALNGFYRNQPEAYQSLLASHEASLQCLLERHKQAVAAGHRYATMQLCPDSHFLAFLRAAIGTGHIQLIFADWLEERDFPHANELRSKRWNRGEWTENQLLDLLSKPFTATRRSFSGRTV